MIDPNVVYERICRAGEEWARLQEDADRTEAIRKRKFSEIVNVIVKSGESVNKAEHHARAHDDFEIACQRATTAAREANLARARYDAAKIWWEAVRTVEATKRAEMKL